MDGREIELQEGEIVDRKSRFFDKAGNELENAWGDTKRGIKKVAEEAGEATRKVGRKVEEATETSKQYEFYLIMVSVAFMQPRPLHWNIIELKVSFESITTNLWKQGRAFPCFCFLLDAKSMDEQIEEEEGIQNKFLFAGRKSAFNNLPR